MGHITYDEPICLRPSEDAPGENWHLINDYLGDDFDRYRNALRESRDHGIQRRNSASSNITGAGRHSKGKGLPEVDQHIARRAVRRPAVVRQLTVNHQEMYAVSAHELLDSIEDTARPGLPY